MANSDSRQRIAILGGTFDPIHLGHLLVAELCREQLEATEVRFIPAAISPLKLNQQPHAESKQRLEMIRLAISGNEKFSVDDRELKRGGTSFTVDTLTELASEMPDAQLLFLMGADSLADFERWREPNRICELAFVSVVARGGHPVPDLRLLQPYLGDESSDTPSEAAHEQNLNSHLIQMPQLEISSSDIRERVTAGRSIRYQVHPAVEAYIDSHQLYRST